MKYRIGLIGVTCTAVCGLVWSAAASLAAPPEESTSRTVEAAKPPSREEARGRAELLHETIHATLQVVHHAYYREDEGLPIPAATLTSVFRELADRKKVEIRWLAVNAPPMNVDHQARNDFEKQAVQSLSAGKSDYEAVSEGIYRRAGPIALTSECLKCHVPNRTSNKSRTAGLVISMPVAMP